MSVLLRQASGFAERLFRPLELLHEDCPIALKSPQVTEAGCNGRTADAPGAAALGDRNHFLVSVMKTLDLDVEAFEDVRDVARELQHSLMTVIDPWHVGPGVTDMDLKRRVAKRCQVLQVAPVEGLVDAADYGDKVTKMVLYYERENAFVDLGLSE